MTRHFKGVTGPFIIALLLASSQAEAAPGGTVGSVIDSVRNSFSNFPDILSAAAYLIGLFFAISGVFKFKDHVENPAQHPLSMAVKKFLAGGMMLSLPFMSKAVRGSLFDNVGDGLGWTGGRHGAPGGDGMDQMIVQFIQNIYGPASMLLNAFTYVAAIVLLLVGITRLTKTAQEGPRGPGGLGTIMTFLACGALFSFGDMMGSFSTSLFGSNTVKTSAVISSSVISNSADSDKISAVIESLMAFIMIVGYIAFIRGWFVLKAFADGSQQATVAQALTFLFGGALAINMGGLINVLQNTLGISGLTFS